MEVSTAGLARSAAAQTEVKRIVQRVNKQLAPFEQVRKFRLLEKELDHDDNEVTATMKVRRATIEKRFGPLIRSHHGGNPLFP